MAGLTVQRGLVRPTAQEASARLRGEHDLSPRVDDAASDQHNGGGGWNPRPCHRSLGGVEG